MLDALISLPVVGYLLMPSTTSYSTSLNLLFFYMTWSTLVLSQPALRVEVIGSLAPRLIFFVLPSTLFLLFDSALPSLAVSLKIQGVEGLPTRGGPKVSKATKGKPMWYRVIGLSLFNILLATAIQGGIELLLTKVLLVRTALKITTTVPMPWQILKDFGKGLVLREFLQYYIHRYILHSHSLVGRLHQQYHHSITAPYSFAAHYDHPLPYLLWRFIPLYLPAAIFRFHMLTYILILCTVTLEETLTLSGYNVVPGIMLGGITRRQDLHNESRGQGNYAPWGLLDWIGSTSVGGDFVDDVQDEAEKHQLKGRSRKLVQDTKRSGKEGMKSLRRSPRKRQA